MRADWKTKMAALAFDGLKHFRFLLCSRWTEFNETCRKHDIYVLYYVCIIRADQKTKMASLSSDWLGYFYFSTEYNETWEEASNQI